VKFDAQCDFASVVYGPQDDPDRLLIDFALEADIPVLIAVPERRFSDWIRFSDGMNVRLPCRREALDLWWRSVEGTSVRRPGFTATFCELAK
jgi:hypothetical protein